MSTAWLVLLVAGFLEIVWVALMKHTEGFSRLLPSILTMSTLVLSFICLSFAIRRLPIGTAYAVWTGIGAAGSALYGVLWLRESAHPMRLLSIGLIIIGIIGIRIFSDSQS